MKQSETRRTSATRSTSSTIVRDFQRLTGCPSGCPAGFHQKPCPMAEPVAPVPTPERCVLEGGCMTDPPSLWESLQANGCARCGVRWPTGGLIDWADGGDL